MRVGIVGKRGLAGISGLRSVAGIEVTSFAEFSLHERDKAQRELGIPAVFEHYEDLLDGVDAVVFGTPMPDHATQCLTALRAEKHVLCEVPVAVSLEECAELAKAIRPGGPVFMMAENYCFFRENMIVSALSERGMFGVPYYAEGAYVHEVRFLHRDLAGSPTWRMKWQVGIRGNTYITHELGPLMMWFRACDPSIRIESVACFGTGTHTDPSLNHDDSCVTMIKLSNGGLINIRLDMVSNRPGKTPYGLQGTLAAYEDGKIWIGNEETLKTNNEHRKWRGIEEYSHLLGPEVTEELAQASSSGHGGSDYMMGRRFAQAIMGLREPAISARESLEWTIAGLVSQQSILQNSALLPMPL